MCSMAMNYALTSNTDDRAQLQFLLFFWIFWPFYGLKLFTSYVKARYQDFSYSKDGEFDAAEFITAPYSDTK